MNVTFPKSTNVSLPHKSTLHVHKLFVQKAPRHHPYNHTIAYVVVSNFDLACFLLDCEKNKLYRLFLNSTILLTLSYFFGSLLMRATRQHSFLNNVYVTCSTIKPHWHTSILYTYNMRLVILGDRKVMSQSFQVFVNMIYKITQVKLAFHLNFSWVRYLIWSFALI